MTEKETATVREKARDRLSAKEMVTEKETATAGAKKAREHATGGEMDGEKMWETARGTGCPFPRTVEVDLHRALRQIPPTSMECDDAPPLVP